MLIISIAEIIAQKGEKMINGFEYRDNLPKCPERSDRWLSPSNDECERDDECEEDDEDGEDDESSDDSHDSRATNTATKGYSTKNS